VGFLVGLSGMTYQMHMIGSVSFWFASVQSSLYFTPAGITCIKPEPAKPNHNSKSAWKIALKLDLKTTKTSKNKLKFGEKP